MIEFTYSFTGPVELSVKASSKDELKKKLAKLIDRIEKVEGKERFVFKGFVVVITES